MDYKRGGYQYGIGICDTMYIWKEGKLNITELKEYDYYTKQMTVKNSDNTICYKGFWKDKVAPYVLKILILSVV